MEKHLQLLQRSQSKSVAERSRRGRKPCGTGALEITDIPCTVQLFHFSFIEYFHVEYTLHTVMCMNGLINLRFKEQTASILLKTMWGILLFLIIDDLTNGDSMKQCLKLI